MTSSGNKESAAGLGDAFSPLTCNEIKAGILGDFWNKVFFYESVDSTNERALALPAPETFAHGTVVITDSQSRGRGRIGRKWISPPGRNIYMSMLLKPEIRPRDVAFLTIAGALAGAVALGNITGLDARIKWPNDLMVNGKKIGGILTESRSGAEKVNIAVIGIGVNVNSESIDFPEELRGVVTSARAETGRVFSRVKIIVDILKELELRYKALVREGRQPLLKEWKGRSSTIGKEVRIVLSEAVLSGVADTVDDEGMLVVRLRSGETRRISSGDVIELR
jgi:BirA family biotin operon repressor/biotin-[acetyl-CoA-carboxylase] ligase